MRDNRKTALLGALLFLLFTLAGVFVGYWIVPDSIDEHSAVGTRMPRSDCGPKSSTPPQPVRDATTSSTVEDQRGPVGSQAPPLHIEHHDRNETADDANVSVTIVCVDSEGTKVRDVPLELVVVEYKSPNHSGKFVARMLKVSDSEGVVELSTSRQHSIRIECESIEWYLRPMLVSLSSSMPIIVTLAPAQSISIRAQYDDGVPVTYMGALRTEAGPDSWTFALDGDGSATLAGIPVNQPLVCRIFASKRGHYDNHQVTFGVHELTSGRELLVVVPKSTTSRGVLRIEFGESGPGARGWVQLESQRGVTHWRFNSGDKHIDINNLFPGIQYRASVFSKLAWRSDWLQLSAGETTVVKADLKPSASVRATLVDESGNLIKHGVLRMSDGDYLVYMDPSTPLIMNTAMMSNEDGVATVTGLPPGNVQLEAEAWGMSPEVVSCTLAPGETIDLGFITLKQGTGEVTVELTGLEEGQQYSVYVGTPLNGGRIYPHYPVEGALFTIRNLPLRRYFIGAILRKGGKVVAKRIELSPSRTTEFIQLDVSELQS